MRRRQFLGLMATLAAAGAAPAARHARAAADRLSWWDPSPGFSFAFPFTALEWRYLAGRITEDGQDFGFVVAIIDYNPPLSEAPRLLVMRQDFVSGAHVSHTYPCTFTYDAASATYTFTASASAAVTATWGLDALTQTYALSVASPELTLSGLTLAPIGELLAEGGTGRIVTSRLGGVVIESDYHADWVAIRRGATTIGTGRLDIQTVDPASLPTSLSAAFAHHWFCLAGATGDGPVWVSAWQVDSELDTWVATVARGTAATGWSVASFGDQAPGLAFPVAVQILDWQRMPTEAGQPARRTGKAWRVTAGQAAPGDLLDLTLGVPPGQFIAGARLASGLTRVASMQESVTSTATGLVLGKPLTTVSFAVAESSSSEDARTFLPSVSR